MNYSAGCSDPADPRTPRPAPPARAAGPVLGPPQGRHREGSGHRQRRASSATRRPRSPPRDVVVFDVNRKAVRPPRSRFDRLYEDEHVLVLDKPAGLLTVAGPPRRRTGRGHGAGPGARVHGTAARRARLRRAAPPARSRHLGRAGRRACRAQAHEAGRELFSAHALRSAVPGAGRTARRPTTPAPSTRRSPTPTPGRPAAAGHRRRAGARRRSRTSWSVSGSARRRRLLELTLETGRQHQIRLHLQRMGHPVLGDQVYGPRRRADGAAADAPRLAARLSAPAHRRAHRRRGAGARRFPEAEAPAQGRPRLSGLRATYSATTAVPLTVTISMLPCPPTVS